MKAFLRNLSFGKALIIGLITTGLYWAIIYDDGASTQASIDKLKKDKENSDTEIKKITKAIEDAKLYEQTMAELGDEMNRIQIAIPTNFAGVDLLKMISTYAKDIGCTINSIAESGVKVDKKDANLIYIPVAISVNLTGTYNQMMTFLSELTKSDKLLTVKNINLTGKTTGNENPIITMAATISGYQYVPKQEVQPKKGGKKK